jgi:uncharacterized protein YggT (Ycf19 family)
MLPSGGRKRMNLARGLLHLWIVVSVIWSCVVGVVVYSLWPQDPQPDDFLGRFDEPSSAHARLRLLLVGAGIVLVGSGSMFLLGAAVIWVIRS